MTKAARGTARGAQPLGALAADPERASTPPLARAAPAARQPPSTPRGANPNPLTLEHRPIDTLIPYARNARTHAPAQV
ncbi:MAG: hypothetical protein LH650_15870, partial [Chloroflexi bacterium]|nr:hypothetical protein [Chloroflexota bacterium]